MNEAVRATYAAYWRVADAGGKPKYDCLDQAEAIAYVNFVYRRTNIICAITQEKVKNRWL